jgi:hypothetical protein
MSWSGLASNQIVSDTNLANAVAIGVFAAKTAIPSTGKELTTTAAVGYAYVDVTAGRASNQLVTKTSLSAVNVGPGPYNYYVYGVDGNTMYQSTNGGFTFSAYTSLPFQGPNIYTVLAASSSGQYLLAASNTINNTIYISTDYGANFYTHNIGNVGTGYTFTTFYPCDADMSSSGQYMVVMGKTQPGSTLGQITIAVSSDYGATFTAYYGAYSASTGSRTSVAISQNGAVIQYVACSSGTNNSWRYLSTNYGSSFSYGGLSTNQLFYDISMSSTGQYILIVNHGTSGSGNFFVSNNTGSSVTSRSTAGGGVYSGMTSNGSIMQVATDNGNVYYSTNNGVNWNQYSVTYYSMIGLAVGDLFGIPMTSNYLAAFQSTYCNYKPTSSSTTFYSQPLTYNYSINKIYRKAINY